MGFRYNRQLHQSRPTPQLNNAVINKITNGIRSTPAVNVAEYRLTPEDYIFLQSIGLRIRNY